MQMIVKNQKYAQELFLIHLFWMKQKPGPNASCPLCSFSLNLFLTNDSSIDIPIFNIGDE